MLEELFKELYAKYSSSVELIVEAWHELADRYSEAHRHYHTLQHLRDMVGELDKYPDRIADRDTLLFSIFYHDMVYRPGRKDNEKKSVELMNNRLSQTAFKGLDSCARQILATEDHGRSEDEDTRLLIDLDLSILGQSTERYAEFREEIREEYLLFPRWIFRRGRRKVISDLLERKFIYQTGFFHGLYEEQARSNLRAELESLG